MIQGNFKVLLGTNHMELVEAAGGFNEEPEKVISGGPMMGFAMFTRCTLYQNIFFYSCIPKMKYQPVKTACINCGRCVDACPSRIIPQDWRFAEHT